MYRSDCPYSVHNFGGILCLSLVGWLFTIVFTYTGFACMIAGKTSSLSTQQSYMRHVKQCCHSMACVHHAVVS